MIADKILVLVMMAVTVPFSIKIHEHKKPGIPGIPPPERIGHPGIEVRIIRRRRIICN
jgi:hypothetical protein